MDETWNPRNKSVADLKFYLDMKLYGCQDSGWIGGNTSCLLGPSGMASVYYFITAKSHLGNRELPVTAQDLAHIGGNWRYIECTSPAIPLVSNLSFTRTGSTLTITWNFDPGCTVGLNDVAFKLTVKSHNNKQTHTVDPDAVSPPCTIGANQIIACSYVAAALHFLRWIEIIIEPKQRRYGPPTYPARVRTYS